MRVNKALGLILIGSLVAATACSQDGAGENQRAGEAALNKGSGKADLCALTLYVMGATQTSIDVKVCAGGTGAPAGFSLQWMDSAAYSALGFSEDDPSYCAASLSGVPAQSVFSLAPGECSTVTIGALDPNQVGVSFQDGCNAGLDCGTEYAFRAFAHGDSDFNRSPFSAVVVGSTLPCQGGGGCTFTQGYWKTHDGSPNADVWPVSTVLLGSVPYSDAELSDIFDTPVKGNGLIALAHQLIAAKLNIASGADPTDIIASVAAADELIDELVVPSVGIGYLAPAETSALVDELTSYNEGTTGPGHCDDDGTTTPLPLPQGRAPQSN